MAAPLTEQAEGDSGSLIHDFTEVFFNNEVKVTYRIVSMPRCLWIWIGDSPLLSNLSVHTARGADALPSAAKLLHAFESDFGTSLGNRLAKKLPEKMVHLAWHLKP
ncbi:hypothetical protein DIPPA_30750, partial [Diplonema papillatum]